MGRYTKASCKLCRREMMKLFLKGERCKTANCSFEKRSFPPGIHGLRPKKLTNYGMQLREKQKVKRIYGLLERQFRNTFHKASAMKGVTGDMLLQLLERRLDNVVYRMGLAPSRHSARQLVSHGLVKVNGKRLDIPSYFVKVNDEISLSPKVKENPCVRESLETCEKNQAAPYWLSVDFKEQKAQVLSFPKREDIEYEIQDHLIIELYSK